MVGSLGLASRAAVVRQTLRSRPLRRALGAYLVFNTAEWATWVAMLVWAFDRGGARAAGLIALIQLVPAALVAPLGSVLGDRMRRSHALAAGYALQSVSMIVTGVALATGAPYGWVAAFAACSASAITLTRPVHHAIVPDIARSPEEMTAGNSASTTVEGLAGFLGPALGGVMLAAWGAASVYFVMGTLSAVSASFTVSLVIRGRAVRSGRDRLLRSAIGGFREVRHDAGAALLVGMVAAQFVLVGLLDILTVVLAIDVLGMDAAGPGLLTSAIGIGALAGGAASLALVGRTRLALALAGAILLTGLPVAALAGVNVPLWAALLLAVYGAAHAYFDVAGRTLLQRTTSPEVLSRIFGVQEALMMLGIAVGSVLAPLAVAAFGARGAFLVAGLTLPLCGLIAWVWIRRLDDRASAPGPTFTVLAALPIFAPLPQRAVEQLSWSAFTLDQRAGTAIVTEGEPGDVYYVVLEGDVVVSREGQQIRRLGPGEGFGEIALLRAPARTATVTARSDVSLAVIDRADFLMAVTGQPEAQATATSVVDRYLKEDDDR